LYASTTAFVISPIRETFDRGAAMDEAVARGITSTAGVVMSRAIVMVAVLLDLHLEPEEEPTPEAAAAVTSA
jgi:hypothetical protein